MGKNRAWLIPSALVTVSLAGRLIIFRPTDGLKATDYAVIMTAVVVFLIVARRRSSQSAFGAAMVIAVLLVTAQIFVSSHYADGNVLILSALALAFWTRSLSTVGGYRDELDG